MMRWNLVKALIEVDLLQSNRQINNNERADKMEKRNVYWRLLFQNGSIILVFVLLFGASISNIPLADYPGIFTESIAMMILISLLQLFQLLYNLFFEDENLSEYLSLPFSLGELFVSKTMTVFLNSLAYFLFPTLFIAVLGWQTGHSLVLSIPIGLLSGFLIMLVTILSMFLALHLLNQTAFFRKHKKLFTIAIYLILFGLIFYVFYGNEESFDVSEAVLQDSAINPLFIGFHEIFIPGSRLAGWLKVGLWVIAGVGLSYAALKWVIPQLYFQEQQPDRTAPKKQNRTQDTGTEIRTVDSPWKVFSKYQLRQLQDTTLILQMLFAKFYLPIIMVGPILFGGENIDLSVLETIPHLWGMFLLIGFVLSFVMMSDSSISGVIISFDKENYHYIQTLPISFQRYLKFKFHFAFLLEWALNMLVILLVGFFLGLGVYLTLMLALGLTAGTYLFSLYYYMRDYRLLDLSWNNFTELMQRGLGQMVRAFGQIFVLIIGTLLVFAFIFWAVFVIQDTTRLWVSLGIALVLAGTLFSIIKYADKNFWVKFNK